MPEPIQIPNTPDTTALLRTIRQMAAVIERLEREVELLKRRLPQ